MECHLCNHTINPYDPSLHHFAVNQTTSVHICNTCTDAFITWQQRVISKLFPTTMMKKRFAKHTS